MSSFSAPVDVLFGVRKGRKDSVLCAPYFTIKDLLGLAILLILLILLTLLSPNLLGDPEHFNHANPFVTFVQIQPEWFLFPSPFYVQFLTSWEGAVALLKKNLLVFILSY